MSDSVIVSRLPLCDICAQVGNESVAEYDAKTVFGPWANLCGTCFRKHAGKLGTGFGQRLVLAAGAHDHA